jgi:hypothetical protein
MVVLAWPRRSLATFAANQATLQSRPKHAVLTSTTVGVILMIVGGAGLVISLVFWSSWGGFGGYHPRSVEYRDGSHPDGTVVHDERTF